MGMFEDGAGGQSPWALAIQFAIAAGRNRAKARELGGSPGLIKVADRASVNVRIALGEGMADLLIGGGRQDAGERPGADRDALGGGG
jgi:hypothetical protein